MRPSSVLLLALSFVLGCGSAAVVPAALPSPIARSSAVPSPGGAPRARPLNAWRVRSAEGHESTLLGTFHVGIDIGSALPPPHDARLISARSVVLELAPGEVDPAVLVPLTVLPENQQLSTLLGAELFAILSARVSVPAEQLERLRPWVASSLVMVADLVPGIELGGADAPPMLDVQLGELAVAHGIPVIGLETITEQAALMDAIPLAAQVEYMRDALGAEPTGQGGGGEEVPSPADLREAYVRGDLDALEAIVFDPAQIAAAPAFFETMLFERNAVWMQKLRPELEIGGLFCAVGIAHLIGERGLLASLRAAGYSVERLSTPRGLTAE